MQNPMTATLGEPVDLRYLAAAHISSGEGASRGSFFNGASDEVTTTTGVRARVATAWWRIAPFAAGQSRFDMR